MGSLAGTPTERRIVERLRDPTLPEPIRRSTLKSVEAAWRKSRCYAVCGFEGYSEDNTEAATLDAPPGARTP